MKPTIGHAPESPDTRSHTEESAPTAIGPIQPTHPDHRPNVINADNAWYPPMIDEDGQLAGNIDEINGLGATEVPFTPTRHELLVISKHWARVIMDLRLDDLVYEEPSADYYWRNGFARCRLKRVEHLLGAETVDQAFKEAEDELRRDSSMTPRQWDILKQGTFAERGQLLSEIRVNAQAWTQEEYQLKNWEEQQEQQRQEEEKRQWVEQHQAARDEERRVWAEVGERAQRKEEGR